MLSSATILGDCWNFLFNAPPPFLHKWMPSGFCSRYVASLGLSLTNMRLSQLADNRLLFTNCKCMRIRWHLMSQAKLMDVSDIRKYRRIASASHDTCIISNFVRGNFPIKPVIVVPVVYTRDCVLLQILNFATPCKEILINTTTPFPGMSTLSDYTPGICWVLHHSHKPHKFRPVLRFTLCLWPTEILATDWYSTIPHSLIWRVCRGNFGDSAMLRVDKLALGAVSWQDFTFQDEN